MLVAAGSARFTQAGQSNLKIKLTVAGKALLNRSKTLRVMSKAACTTTRDATVTAIRTIALKR